MFEDIIKQLDELDGMEIEISAKGQYPTKQHPKVQSVAKWQNDGTKKDGREIIKPAKFVEAAEKKNKRMWLHMLAEGAFDFVFEGHERDLQKAGNMIAQDINEAVNRIDTGRLRESFRSVVKK